MKRLWILTVVALGSAAIGLATGTTLAATQEAETNYMVIQDFGLAPGITPNEGIESLSEWVRAIRATGKHKSVRLFMHYWGSDRIFYLVSETSDWDAIGTFFEDLLAAQPGFMDEPWIFGSHSDEILTEIPVL